MSTKTDNTEVGKPAGPYWGLDPRVQLAAERTLLAWVRTGLAFMGFGFVVARFGLFLKELAIAGNHPVPGSHLGSLIMGIGLVGIGVWIVAVAAIRYRGYIAVLTAGKDAPPPGALFGVTVAGSLALLGLFIVVYLLSIG